MRTAAVQAAEAAWQSAASRRRAQWMIAGLLFVLAITVSARLGEVDLVKLAQGLGLAGDYLRRTVPALSVRTFVADMAEWFWGFDIWLWLLLDTLLVAYAGTLLGGVAALLLSFAAASTLAPPWAVMVSRRVLELARTVPVFVFALIFVYAFGLGPFAGLLAVAMHTTGALGKLFSEVHEGAELAPVEAMRAAGASWWQQMRYGVFPQSLPGILSFGLLRFEINVREASVLGVVGAGGIGEELYLAVRQFEYPDISAIVLMILVTVSLIDLVCGRLRHAVIGPVGVMGR